MACYGKLMSAAMPVRLMRDEEGQFVHIPAAFELPGEEAEIRREGGRLVLQPAGVGPKTLRELLESWEPIDERIGPIEDQPPEPVHL